MAALTSKRRAVSRGKNNSKNIGHKFFYWGERGKKPEFPMWGGQQDGYPSHPPPPPRSQLAELFPKIGGIAISHHVIGAAGNAKWVPRVHQQSVKCAPSDAKCPPSVCQGVVWPVWCWVRKRHFLIKSSINGYFKTPFSQVRVENLLLAYWHVKVCPPLVYELWEPNILLM